MEHAIAGVSGFKRKIMRTVRNGIPCTPHGFRMNCRMPPTRIELVHAV